MINHFYHVYKGEYNYDKDIGIHKESLEKIIKVIDKLTVDNLDDAVLMNEFVADAEEILEVLFEEDDE